MQLERVRVAEVQPVQPFGDDDRVAAVRREIHVVRIVDGDRASGLAIARIDRGERVAEIVRHVQRFQVPRGDDVLRQRTDRKMLDDPERSLVDHVHGVAVAVRNVDVRACTPRLCAEVAGPVGGVDVRSRRCLGLPDRLRRGNELRQVGHRARGVASAGDEDSASVGNRRKIRAWSIEPADEANVSPRGVDGDDAVGRGSHRAAAPADHEGARSDRGGGGMGRRRGKPPEPHDAARA